jgi:SAM-dependent methyltransferase
MDVTLLRALLEPTGQRLLTAATDSVPTPVTLLQQGDRLRKHFPPELVPVALAQVLLRQKAKAKFAQADVMYFTRELLEMSTSEQVAAHRAARFASYGIVLDLCCGLGSDALALTRAGCKVVAWDTDRLAVELCAANASALGYGITVVLHDALKDDFPQIDATFADPARRHDGRRHLKLADYQPSPVELMTRFQPTHPLAIKLAPGVRVEEVDALGGELEFVSLDGELKEAVLWVGEFVSCRRRATLLTVAGTRTLIEDSSRTLPELGPIQTYLYDPDPAVVRAGLVPKLANLLHATQTDGLVQLLTKNDLTATHFATAYRVEEVLPVDIKRINTGCQARGIGRVTIVNRGSLAVMNEVQRKLKPRGKGHRHLILTRQLGQQVAVLAEKVEVVTSRHPQ